MWAATKYLAFMLVACLASWAPGCSTVQAQDVYYMGRWYRGNAVCCSNGRCGMRQAILAKRSSMQVSLSQSSYRLVKVCEGGVCRYVREPAVLRSEAATRVAVQQEVQPALSYTPHAAIEGLLDVLDVQPGESLIDVGCGDGRWLVAASKRGLKAIGLEIDVDAARRAEANLRAAGCSRARVLVVDGRHWDYRRFDYVTFYLDKSTMAQVIRRVLPGTTVISYMHNPQLPRQKKYEAEMDGRVHTFYVAVR